MKNFEGFQNMYILLYDVIAQIIEDREVCEVEISPGRLCCGSVDAKVVNVHPFVQQNFEQAMAPNNNFKCLTGNQGHLGILVIPFYL